ncbi:phage tail tape measure protein [Flavobacterium granuli]|uniref:Tubulin-specific chaperone A n=1 Tax=Flavobacterium granuli TaxID=280093 RepID=A0ABU1S0I4_9FLAO|nr:phage tail tape measure protein [Flavobacterium granuli]MDR6844536.1 tubulin-specific chaperone A [Flavobacterium granuli]
MAKTISDEKLKLSIEINGNSAQKGILELEKAVIKLKHANSDYAYEQKMIAKQLGKDSQEYKNLTAKMKANSLEIEQSEAKLQGLISNLKLTEKTMGQLGTEASVLGRKLKLLDPNSSDWKKTDADLKQVNGRMQELRSNSQTAKISISSLADGFNKYQGMALGVIATLTGVVLSVQKIIDINGKLSDAQSDVMKTTGMTKIEVDELTKSFGLLQTRTSRIDLLGIAEQGGRIGIAKAEIGDFVNVMNKASVALGDSFTGGAEEVANKLGKIKFLFEETKNLGVEQAYNSIGSAINDLGANGTASEANIADFTTRIGSLTDVLKPTIQETLALGTAFEESGIESEVSARAYGIFMKQAATESGKFAKVMGISQKAVENMINTDPLEFMLKFSEGMRGMDATKTAKTLDYLGISADGANKVIGAMGNNVGRFRELIDLSNNSFASGTSLVNEYDIKNNNLAATLEKISKTVSGWFSSETFIKWLTIGVNWLANFIGATEEANKEVSAWRIMIVFTAKILALMVASLISYTAWTTIAALRTRTLGEATAWNLLQQKLQVMWTSLQIAGLTIYTGVMNFFGITTTRATAALKAMNVATATSPWGAVLAVLTAVIGAYIAFKDSVNNSVVAQESFSKQQKKLVDEVGKSTSATKAHMSSLVTVINDTNVSLETRKKAYEDLVKIAPEFNGLLVKEGQEVYGLTAIYATYIEALDQVARAKAFAKLNEGNIEKEINATQRLYNAEVRLSNARKAKEDYYKKGGAYNNKNLSVDERVSRFEGISDELANAENEFKIASSLLSNTKKIVKETNNFKKNEVKDIQDRINLNEKELASLEKKYKKEVALKSSRGRQLAMLLKADKESLNSLLGVSSSPTPDTSDYNVPGDSSDKSAESARKKREEAEKKQLEDTRKFLDEKLKLERQAQDNRLYKMEEGEQKEIIIEQVNLGRKIEDLEKGLIKEQDIEQAFANSKNEKLSKNTRAYWKAQAEQWQSLNDSNNSDMEHAVILHDIKVATIKEKYAKEAIEKEQEQYELGKLQRETNFNNELAELDLSDKAKKKRQDDFDKNELVLQKEHLKKKIDELKKVLSEGILTPEGRDKFNKDIAFLENAMSKIQIAKDPKKQSGAEKLGEAAKSAFGEQDILGFTPTQWTDAFNNLDSLAGKLQALDMVLIGMQNAWGLYGNYQNAVESAALTKFERASDAKKNKLKRQLDSGMISQKTYNKQVDKIDKELEKKKAETEYNKAKREKQMAIVSAVISTAKGVAASLPNFILAGIAAAIGAIQIATIAKQPLPAKGYESGLYGNYVKREQDGKVFKSKYAGKTRSGLVSDTSHFLVAENGPEMVIDNKAWRQMHPAVKDSLIRELNGIKGWEKGLYNQEARRYEVPAETNTTTPSSSNDNQLLQMVLAVVAENTEVMKNLRDNGVVGKFFKNDLQSAKNIQDSIKDFNDLRNKAKK